MSEDDWRYRKAQQLGLIDDRPLGASGDGRRPAAPVPPHAGWTPAPPPAPPKAARPQSRASIEKANDGPSRLAFAGGTAIALLVAAGAGWLLNDAVGQRSMAEFPPPVVAVADPVNPPVRTSEAAARSGTATRPDTLALPVDAVLQPADLPPEQAPPVQEPPVEVPPLQAPPVQAPPPAPVVAAAPAVVAPRAARPPKPRVVLARDSGVFAPTRGGRPSFNCRRARSRDSQLICASPELSGLDREMAQAYRAAVRRSGGWGEARLDRDQSAFLNARSACQTAPCIARLYYRRLDRLDRG